MPEALAPIGSPSTSVCRPAALQTSSAAGARLPRIPPCGLVATLAIARNSGSICRPNMTSPSSSESVAERSPSGSDPRTPLNLVAHDWGGSPAGDALGIDVERIDRVARGHEQAVAVAAAEADVGAALRERDEADRLAVGVEHLDAVKTGAPHAPAAPQIAVDIDAEAVRRFLRIAVDQDAAVGELGSVDHVEHVDRAPL